MNIVQLIGGSGSGKSALAQELTALGPGTTTALRTNRYLRNRQPTDGDDFLMMPTSIDWPLVRLHIEMLANGQNVIMPDYDWKTGRRLPPRLSNTAGLGLKSTNLLIIESLHRVPDLRTPAIFIDAPVAVRRAAVSKRDAELSGNFADHFDRVTEPGYQRYTAPLREQCDLIIDGTTPIGQQVDRVQRFLTKLWGSWD